MNKQSMFLVNNEELFVELVLINAADIQPQEALSDKKNYEPILFVCKSNNNNYYIALRTQPTNNTTTHVVALATVEDIVDMIVEKITIQDLFVKKYKAWKVIGERNSPFLIVENIVDFSDSNMTELYIFDVKFERFLKIFENNYIVN